MDITIKESQIPKLLEFYNSRQSELRGAMIALKKELDENQAFINSLTQKTKAAISSPKLFSPNGDANIGYKQQSPWLDKICFVLKNNEKIMNTGNIVETIMSLESGDRERKSYVSSISGTISLKEGKGQILRITKDREFYIALPEWVENGNIKPEYDIK